MVAILVASLVPILAGALSAIPGEVWGPAKGSDDQGLSGISAPAWEPLWARSPVPPTCPAGEGRVEHWPEGVPIQDPAWVDGGKATRLRPALPVTPPRMQGATQDPDRVGEGKEKRPWSAPSDAPLRLPGTTQDPDRVGEGKEKRPWSAPSDAPPLRQPGTPPMSPLRGAGKRDDEAAREGSMEPV